MVANFFSDVTDVNHRLIRPRVTGMGSSSVTAGALRRGLGGRVQCVVTVRLKARVKTAKPGRLHSAAAQG